MHFYLCDSAWDPYIFIAYPQRSRLDPQTGKTPGVKIQIFEEFQLIFTCWDLKQVIL